MAPEDHLLPTYEQWDPPKGGSDVSAANDGSAQPDPEAEPPARRPRGNPAPVYRDAPRTEVMEAASARATTVSHRFGTARPALIRRDVQQDNPDPGPSDDDDTRDLDRS
jgi:hypothetical protein